MRGEIVLRPEPGGGRAPTAAAPAELGDTELPLGNTRSGCSARPERGLERGSRAAALRAAAFCASRDPSPPRQPVNANQLRTGGAAWSAVQDSPGCGATRRVEAAGSGIPRDPRPRLPQRGPRTAPGPPRCPGLMTRTAPGHRARPSAAGGGSSPPCPRRPVRSSRVSATVRRGSASRRAGSGPGPAGAAPRGGRGWLP